MKQIHKPLELVESILPKVIVDNNKTYRKSIYVFDINIINGTLLYNALTNELLFIDKDEDKKEELIEKYYLVPEDFDEAKLCSEIKEIIKTMNIKKDSLASFTILPTTKCNARCFYCYEHGVEKIDMTRETALDVVKFIKDKNFNNHINLEWFGGEPLCNVEIIDLITSELTKLGIVYSSSMITNGYLFNEDIIKRCKDLWKVKHIQITIDGTREKYNEIKSYVYNDPNSYDRVINNIRLITDNKIRVSIRLNLSASNFDDINKLCDELREMFKDNRYVTVYVASISQYDAPTRFEELHEEESNKDKFKVLLDKTKVFKKRSANVLSDEYKDFYCQADLDTCVMILPDGRLSLCEHFLDQETAGDIYSGLDRSVKNSWKKKVCENNINCKRCKLYPICNLPVKCPANDKGCTYEYRISQLRVLQDKILNTYRKYKQ